MVRLKMNKRLGRTTIHQYEKMLTFMDNHKDFATNKLRGAQVRVRYIELWNELTDILNSVSGPKKCVTQWQSTWSDWKMNVKKRWKSKHELLKKAVENEGTTPELRPIDEKLLCFLGIASINQTNPEVSYEILESSLPESANTFLMPPEDESEEVVFYDNCNNQMNSPIEFFTPNNKRKLENGDCENEILDISAKQLILMEQLGRHVENLSKNMEKNNEILINIANSVNKQSNAICSLVNYFINKK